MLPDKKGPVDCINSNEALKNGLGIHDQITANVENKGNLILVPSHLSPLEFPLPKFFALNLHQVTPEAHVATEERQLCALIQRMQNNPEKMHLT